MVEEAAREIEYLEGKVERQQADFECRLLRSETELAVLSMEPSIDLEDEQFDYHDKVFTEVREHLAAWQAEGVGATLPPQQAVAALVRAQRCGAPAHMLLDRKAAALRLECKKASLSVVAAALRYWHAFAIMVLRIPPNQTLPPRSDS